MLDAGHTDVDTLLFDKDLNYTITTHSGGDIIMLEIKDGKKDFNNTSLS